MSTGSITRWTEVGNSLFADYINKQIIDGERPAETQSCRIATIFLAIFGIAGGYAASNVFIKTALAYPQRTIAIISAIGCGIGFGSFFAEGWLRVIQGSTRPLHQEELKLRRNYQSTAALVAVSAAAVFFGTFAQFGLIEVCEENYTDYAMAIGIASMVGSSGPLICSVYDTIDFLVDMIKNGVIKCRITNRPLQALLSIKKMMISNFRENIRYALTLPLEQRQLQFKAFYQRECINLNAESISSVFETTKGLFILKEQCKNTIYQRNVCLVSMNYIVCAVLITLSAGFFIEQGTLSYGSAKDIASNTVLIILLTLIALAPWIWKALTVPSNAATGIFNQITGVFGFGHPTTFVEQFHPKLSKLVDILALLATALTYPQITTLATECCFDTSTTKGNILLFGSLVTIMSYFFYSLKTLVEKGIMAVDKYGCDLNLKDLVALKEKTDEALNVLEKLDLPDLEAFLQANNANEKLIKSILGCQEDDADVKALIRHFNEWD